jgi:hypothetical protein
MMCKSCHVSTIGGGIPQGQLWLVFTVTLLLFPAWLPSNIHPTPIILVAGQPTDDVRFSVVFDGLSAYLKLPAISGIRAVSMWLFLDRDQQHTQTKFLIDARYETSDSYYSSDAIGVLWESGQQFVNGVETDVDWAQLPMGG